MALPPLRRERLYESLAAHITDFIEAQGLVGGDRLPPERQLAAELGVSRATLSRALAALETRGRIEVRHGVGALVREPGGTALLEGVGDHPPAEVATAREAVLAGLARAAATNPQDALRLALLGADGRPRSFAGTWRCLRRLAGSALLADLDDTLAEHSPDPVDGSALSAHLDRIAAAVVAGDPATSAALCVGLLAQTPPRPS